MTAGRKGLSGFLKNWGFWGLRRGCNLHFWVVRRVFARANAQVLKWARQKCREIGKKFAKARAFWAEITKNRRFLSMFDF